MCQGFQIAARIREVPLIQSSGAFKDQKEGQSYTLSAGYIKGQGLSVSITLPASMQVARPGEQTCPPGPAGSKPVVAFSLFKVGLAAITELFPRDSGMHMLPSHPVALICGLCGEQVYILN